MMRGCGYGYGPMMGGGGGFLFVGLLFFLFFVLVAALIVLLIVWAVRSSKTHGHHPMQPGAVPSPVPGQPGAMPSSAGAGAPMPGGAGHDEAIATAKRRYAAGEIGKDEYEEIIRTLNG